MFTVDGVLWPWPCSVERAAEVRATDISGLMLDRSYFNDVSGTYMSYTVTVTVPVAERDQYSALYEQLTAPVDGHLFTLPYNQGMVELTGRVSGDVSDRYMKLTYGGKYWRGGQFTIIANQATKFLSLDEVITRGRTMLPELSNPSEGDSYTWHNGAWAYSAEYRDADVIAY